LALFLIFTLISVLLSSCLNTKNEEETQEELQVEDEAQVEEYEPVRGGTLFLHCITPDTLNPLTSKSKSVKQVLSLVYEGLVKLDQKLNAVPSLAERWEVSADALTWTFYLRKDVKWHDNTPFTADDVEFTLKTLAGVKYDSIYKQNIQQVSYFSVLDQHTIKLVLKSPNSNFVNLMVFPIVPKHQFSNIDYNPLGTGPYRFVEYSARKYIKFTANDLWWNENKPYIDYIHVRIIPDHNTALYALEAKEIDMVSTDIVDWEKYSSKDNLKVAEYVTNQYEFLGVNFNNKVLSENAVRKAIAFALDREAIINEVLLGHARIVDSPFNNEMWVFDSSAQVYYHDIQKARDILINAGWADSNADGIFDKVIDNMSVPLSFEVLVNEDNDIRVRTAEMIVKQLMEIGMNVRLKKVPWEDMNNLINMKQYDMVLSAMNLSGDADLSFAFHSSAIGTGTNFISYNNPQMDQLLSNALIQTTDNGRKQAFSQLNDYIIDELPYISLYLRTSAIIYNSRIKGELNPHFSNIYNDIEKLYIEYN